MDTPQIDTIPFPLAMKRMEGMAMTVEFTIDNLSVGEQGHVLMEAEAWLSKVTSLPIELFLETRKDENKLRFQTLEKVKDWQKRKAIVSGETRPT